MEEAHAHRIEWRAPSGILKLTNLDEIGLVTLLQNNNGSKDTIKTTRKWILERAHSIVHIGILVRKYVEELAFAEGTSAYIAVLHTAYVLNDVLYNSKGARSRGPYTKISTTDSPVDVATLLVPYLGAVLRAGFATATEDAQRDKVLRLVELWTLKCFISETEGEAMMKSLSSAEAPVEGPAPALVSPYLESPLPSNAPVTVAAPPSATPALPNTNNTAMSSQPVLSESQLNQLQLIQQRIQVQMFANQMQQQQQQPSPPPPNMPNPSFPLPPGGGQFFPSQAFYPQMMPMPGQIAPPPGPYPPGQIGGPYQMAPPPGPYPSGQLAPPYPSAPLLDLTRIPVGNMVNIVKAAKRAGHPPHTTLDIMLYASHAMPHVEPGRVDARVADFYRHVEILSNPESVAASSTVNSVAGSSSAGEGSGDGNRKGKHYTSASGLKEGEVSRREGGAEESWEKYVPGYEDEKDSSSSNREQELGRVRGRKQSRYGSGGLQQVDTAAATAMETEISEENVGHKLLRGLGWQHGSGLGADGSGIVAPISAKTVLDKSGVGKGAETEVPTLQDGTIDYAAYRKQLSTHYHSSYVRSSDR